jgi:hypothetical protein
LAGWWLFYYQPTNQPSKEIIMYALKIIAKKSDGSKSEMVRYIGRWYTVDHRPDDDTSGTAAGVEYFNGTDISKFAIERCDEAYITTVEGVTVDIVNRGAA